MAIKYSVAHRNSRLNALRTELGASGAGGFMEIRSGAQPANCAANATGTLLATIALSGAFMNSPSGGSITKAGTWSDASADASGTIGHFRIYHSVDAAGGPCRLQGSAGVSGTDMITDAATLTAGQVFNVLTFTITDGGA